MRLFVTVVRGMLHKRTERIDLDTAQPTTDELILIVSAMLGLPEHSFRILLELDRKNLRIIRGWPLRHYGIESGYKLSIQLLEEHINSQTRLTCVAEEEEVGSEPQQNDIVSFTSTKSECRQYLDTQLQLLLNEARAGNLDRFCQILRERPHEAHLSRDVSEKLLYLLLNELGEVGWSVLHCAVVSGCQAMVEFLLIKNVNVNLETIEGWTPLMLAIRSRKLDILRLLLEHPNIEVNRVTQQGTALYLAVDSNLLSFTEVLLNHKADQTVTAKDGLKAIDACRSAEMQKLLKREDELIGQQPFILQGEVYKENILFQMKPRYLVCNPFKNLLARYESYKNYPRSPTQVVELTSVKDVRLLKPSDIHILTDKNFYFFQVFCPDRQIYGTKSQETAELWVKSIFQSVGHCLIAEGRALDVQFKKVVKVNLTGIIPKISVSLPSESMERRSRGPSMFGSLKMRNVQSVVERSICQNSFKRKEGSFEEVKSSATNSPQKTFDQISQPKITSFESKITENERKSQVSKTAIASDVQISNIPSSLISKNQSQVLFTSRKGSQITEKQVVYEKTKFESFQLVEQLGKGAFGKVFLARKKSSEKLYALKALQKRILMLQRQMKYAISQVAILKQVDHPFVVRLYYSFQTARNLYMCLDYCACGDLSEYLAQKQKLSEDEARCIVAQLILAIQYLHQRRILYRDLKPQNILLHEDGYIRLADFGLSKADCIGVASSFCGSPAYLSPEMLSHRGVGVEADIYGIGCVLYEMLTGSPPFFVPDIDKLYKNIRQGKLSFQDTDLSEQVKDLLRQLLKTEPTRRITLSQAKNHIFFRKIHFEKLLEKEICKINFPKRLKNPTDEDSDCENEKFVDEDYAGDIRPNRVTRYSFTRPFS